MNRKLHIVCFIIACLAGKIFAQEDKPVQDSTIMIEDSVIYNSIDEASGRNLEDSAKYHEFERKTEQSKFGRIFYRILFKPLGKKAQPQYSTGQIIESSFHSLAQGKVIRNITVTTMDPFGYSLRDTSIHPSRAVLRFGNSLHSNTNTPVIRNLLLFNAKERYDSLIVKESERLIRSQRYIRDVYLDVSKASRDSVDVNIRVLDVWTLLPSAKMTSSEIGLGFQDLNFLGTGTTLELSTRWKRNSGGNITHMSYLMPNIRNTYTSLNIQYLFSPNRLLTDIHEFDRYFFSPVSYNPQYMFSDNRNIVRSIELNRPFFSPRTRWAGGAFLGTIMTTQTFINTDTIRFLSAGTNVKDFWIGRSWQIERNNQDERITSIVLTGRYVHTSYPRRPAEAIDANIFNNQGYYFASLNLTSRKYYRDRYIFNYGYIEDVPAGLVAGITIGGEYQERSRLYIGLNAGKGRYYPFGYLSAHFSYGTFMNRSGFQQGMLTGRLTYFTRLLTAGNWKIRQFIRPSFAVGIKKSPVDNQPINIGIKGFESIESLAPGITVISLQTQSYAPWNLAGFHFGPYLYTHIGVLGEQPAGYKGRVYSLFGLGMLIKNEYLMFNTFQISISFYPYIPENRYNLFRTNAYKTSDYGFREFEVSKPGIVE